MTVETRYPRDTMATVNGLLAFELLTSLGTGEKWTADYFLSSQIRFGIRVFKRSSGGVETEISVGTPVAIIQRVSTATGLLNQSATWACPQTSLATTDSIIVRIYRSIDDGAWALCLTVIDLLDVIWQTPQLGDTQLDASTWTVRYRSNLYWHTTDECYYCRAKTASITAGEMQIENFSHSTGAPPPAGGILIQVM